MPCEDSHADALGMLDCQRAVMRLAHDYLSMSGFGQGNCMLPEVTEKDSMLSYIFGFP